MRKRPASDSANTIKFPRADPKALASFDPNTKRCTMNCGPHAKDQRSEAERKFLCDDCITQEGKQKETR